MDGATVWRLARVMSAARAALLLFVIAVTGAWSADAQAAGWLSPVGVSAPQTSGPASCGFLSGQPGIASVDVAVTPAGETVATWTRANGGTQEVQAAVRPPGGAFGPAQTLGTTQPCYFIGILGAQPKVAVDPKGNAVVVWAHPLATTSVIQAAVRPAGGSFGPPADLSDASRNAQSDPDVTISADGTIVAVWTWNNGSKNVIQTSTRAPGGAFPPAGTAATLSNVTQDAAAARVASNDRGDVAVVWRRTNGTNQIAQARVRPAGGAFAPVVDLSGTGADADAPAVAIDPVGRATAVWTRSSLVESRFLTAAGAIDGGIDNVSDTAETVNYPTIALDASNNAVAVWVGGSNQTKAASRASRASFGTPQTISGPGSSSLLPAVAMDPSGTAVAVWTQSQSTTTIQAATRPPGGSFGGVEDISQGSGAYLASLAIDGEANAIVGWTFSPSGSPQVAQVTAYDAAPPTISAASVPSTGTTGTPVGMSAAASDRWSGANLSWSFGDGGSGTGPSVSHAYGAPGVYTVTITATDGAGNGTSTQRTIQVANPVPSVPAPPVQNATTPPTPRINVTLSFKYSASNSSTKLTSFAVKGVPTGATVTVGCTPPKRKGKTPRCPARDFRKANARGTVKPTTFVSKRFKRNTVIEVRVTKPGMVGAVKRLTIRGRSGPTTSTSCLPEGAKTPARC